MFNKYLAFNINNPVTFSPTSYAHEVHYEKHIQFWENAPDLSYEFRFKRKLDYTPMNVDSNGFVTMSMHAFMNTFGAYLFAGAENIAEDCVIMFAESHTHPVLV